jgi:hypothetical protein
LILDFLAWILGGVAARGVAGGGVARGGWIARIGWVDLLDDAVLRVGRVGVGVVPAAFSVLAVSSLFALAFGRGALRDLIVGLAELVDGAVVRRQASLLGVAVVSVLGATRLVYYGARAAFD